MGDDVGSVSSEIETPVPVPNPRAEEGRGAGRPEKGPIYSSVIEVVEDTVPAPRDVPEEPLKEAAGPLLTLKTTPKTVQSTPAERGATRALGRAGRPVESGDVTRSPVHRTRFDAEGGVPLAAAQTTEATTKPLFDAFPAPGGNLETASQTTLAESPAGSSSGIGPAAETISALLLGLVFLWCVYSRHARGFLCDLAAPPGRPG